MIARDTIEEKVIALSRRKAALFTGVMDDGDPFASTLPADDIRGPARVSDRLGVGFGHWCPSRLSAEGKRACSRRHSGYVLTP